MLNIFVNPTPKQYFYLTIGYVIIAGVLAYFLSSGIIVFMASIMSVHLIATAYHLQTVEKVRDKQKLSKQWFHCFAIPFGLIFYLVMYSGFLFREEFVLQKEQLQQVSGVIPNKHTHESRRSGKSSRSFYYLTINDINFHCSEDDADDCENIYAYKGKNATVYYQSDTKNGNLAYEIVVNDVKPLVIYQFDNQLKSFQENRKKENTQLIFAFILYFLPAFYLLFLYRNMIAYLQEMDDDEKEIFDIENTQENIKNQQIQVKDYGIFGFVSMVIGAILLSLSLIVAIMFFIDNSIVILLIFLVMLIISIAMIYFPYKNGKRNRDIRLGYVDNTEYSDNDNILKIKDYDNKESGNDNYIYKNNYNNNQSIKLRDFTIFGIVSSIIGILVLVFCLMGILMSSLDGYFGRALFWLCVGFISFLMIYKPYQTAMLNRDIRIGLYDDYEEEYDDEYQEPSLLYKIFRIVVLFILIPLFLLTCYSMLVNLARGEIIVVMLAIFILFLIGYGIKKFW